MRVWVYALAFAAIAVSQASAWNPATYSRLCAQTAVRVWNGETAIECLQDIDSYLVGVKNDSENLKDFSTCPIKVQPHAKYLCGNRTYSAANATSQEWFNRALNSSTVCERVRNFCIGSAYHSETFFPTRGLRVESDNKCEDEIASDMDWRINNTFATDANDGWEEQTVCRFTYHIPKLGSSIPTRYRQTFSITDRTLERMMEAIVEIGGEISESPRYSTTSTSTTTSSSTTSTLAATTTVPEVKSTGIGRKAWILALIPLAAAAAYYARRRSQKQPQMRWKGHQ